MRIYKELESLGFFEWYCTQYGGLVYQKYESVYDELPLDNLIRTKLNACVFKFIREKYGYDVLIKKCGSVNAYQFTIEWNFKLDGNYHFTDYPFIDADHAEFNCIKKIIETIKGKML